MELLKDLPISVVYLIVFVLLWLAKELWDNRKKTIESNSLELKQNTAALIDLKAELRILRELLISLSGRIDKAEKDLHSIHEYDRRTMNNGN